MSADASGAEPDSASSRSRRQPAKRGGGQRKPVSLAPMTVNEALQRTFAAGPMPKKPRKQNKAKKARKPKAAKNDND